MVNVTVFEQAPQLQTGELKQAARGPSAAESAVEAIDRPQLSAVLQHCKQHLLGSSWDVSSGLRLKTREAIFAAEPDLFVLGAGLSRRDHGQQMFDVESHVCCARTD